MSWEQAGVRGASWSEGSELGVREVSTVYTRHCIWMELYMHGAVYVTGSNLIILCVCKLIKLPDPE